MKLSAGSRNKLKASQFAGPGRSYPVPDKSHARNAKARASEELHKGNLSQAAYDHIIGKADRVLKR